MEIHVPYNKMAHLHSREFRGICGHFLYTILHFPGGIAEGKFSSIALGILPKLPPVKSDKMNLSTLSLPLVSSKSGLGKASSSLLADYFSWLFLQGATEDCKANALRHSMNNVGTKGKNKRQKHQSSHLSFLLLNAKHS